MDTKKLQNTIATIANYLGDQHPELRSLQLQQHKLRLSKAVADFHKNTVAYGPFKGLRFIEDAHWGHSDRGTMILGLYEQEMLRELTSLSRDYRVFIDLGAADGYYGIGVLVNQLFDKSYCFEISEKGREVIQRNAALNGVSDRVVIKGEATRHFADEIPDNELGQAVLFVDIEGAEFDLLDRGVFNSFRDSVIFVELHDWFYGDGDTRLKRLVEASADSHTVRYFKTGSRDLSGYPELQRWNDLDRWLLCSEGRAQLMTWARFDPLPRLGRNGE